MLVKKEYFHGVNYKLVYGINPVNSLMIISFFLDNVTDASGREEIRFKIYLKS
jgi:hypothetical protein